MSKISKTLGVLALGLASTGCGAQELGKHFERFRELLKMTTGQCDRVTHYTARGRKFSHLPHEPLPIHPNRVDIAEHACVKLTRLAVEEAAKSVKSGKKQQKHQVAHRPQARR